MEPYTIEPLDGASRHPGDYLYRSSALRWDLESGMWGILRVKARNLRCRCEDACRGFQQRWKKKWYEK